MSSSSLKLVLGKSSLKETSDIMQFRNVFIVALLASADAALGAKRKLKLDSDQQVWIENQPILDSTVGDGALNMCRQIAQQHVSNPAAPTVKVCGGGIFTTFYLRGRCESYHHHQQQVGTCGNVGCETFSPANLQEFGGYQSYKIEQC